MIEISIKNADLTPMWFLLGSDIFLTFENPGPIKIDETQLTSQQKMELEKSIKSDIIHLHNSDKIFTITKTPQQLVQEQRLARIEKMRQFLTQQIKTLKIQIKNQSISDLKILLDEEKAGKARKTIIDLIEKTISKHQAEAFIAASRITDNQKTPNQKFQDLKDILHKVEYIENIGDVEDLEQEEIEISYGV
jgi:hypothetical protein